MYLPRTDALKDTLLTGRFNDRSRSSVTEKLDIAGGAGKVQQTTQYARSAAPRSLSPQEDEEGAGQGYWPCKYPR